MRWEIAKAIKPALKSSTAHGAIDLVSPLGCADEKHSDQIGICFVSMDICCGPEAADSDGPPETLVFLLDHENISIGHQQQMNHFTGDPQTVKGMTQSGEVHGREECNQQ